jgi:hypothetical protein
MTTPKLKRQFQKAGPRKLGEPARPMPFETLACAMEAEVPSQEAACGCPVCDPRRSADAPQLDLVRAWLRTQETLLAAEGTRIFLHKLNDTADANGHDEMAGLASRCSDTITAKIQSLRVPLAEIAERLRDDGIAF